MSDSHEESLGSVIEDRISWVHDTVTSHLSRLSVQDCWENGQVVLYALTVVSLAWALEQKWPGSAVGVALMAFILVVQNDDRWNLQATLRSWLGLQGAEEDLDEAGEEEGSPSELDARAGGDLQLLRDMGQDLDGDDEDDDGRRELVPGHGGDPASVFDDALALEAFSWQDVVLQSGQSPTSNGSGAGSASAAAAPSSSSDQVSTP